VAGGCGEETHPDRDGDLKQLHEGMMAIVALFHSVFGLRKVEIAAARRMENAGHTVITPDLYSGRVASSLEDGFELMATIGWETICRRARAALDLVPETTVLAGHSMGAGVVANVWPDRQACAGIILVHGLAKVPDNARRGIPITVHVADRDQFAPADDIGAWTTTAIEAGANAKVFTYANAGHFYTDQTLADHDPDATERTWERILSFLDTIAVR
jgi:dienelactone hydrolase